MKLTELQRKLPIVADNDPLNDDRKALFHGPTGGIVASDIMPDDAAYLAHCANHLPGVLEELKLAQVALFKAEGYSEAYQRINKALAAAEEVEGI